MTTIDEILQNGKISNDAAAIVQALGVGGVSGGSDNTAVVAKLPAPGVAGTSSADVLSTQGVAGGTPMPVSSATLATAANQVKQLTGLPYGADRMDVTTQVAAGPRVIAYKIAGTTVKTRTISYTNAGASSSDTLTSIVDT